MGYDLDDDSALEELGAGGARGERRFGAVITDRWNIGPVPNGGYLAYVALLSAMRVAPQPDPFSVTTHYLRPAKPGPVELLVEPVRLGRGHSTLEVRMFQEGAEILRQLSIVGDHESRSGPTHLTLTPPALPKPDECERRRAGPTSVIPIADRVDVRTPVGAVSWMPGPDGAPPQHSNRAELSAWLRLRDGREPDACSLVFFADALPPPILNLASVVTPWVPTLELTVHVRGRPAPGYLRVVFRTHALIDGYLEEDGEIWDGAGKLVAISRQLARVHKP